MLLTRASEYALLSLILIAKKKTPEDVETLSKKLNISKSFLAKILQNMAKNDILKSYKGAHGGFTLNKKAEDISIKEIIDTVEKRSAWVFDCSAGIEFCPTQKGKSCVIWPFLNKLQSKIDEFLEEMTLKDVIE